MRVDKNGRKFTLAKWVFIVATFILFVLLSFLPFGWISGKDFLGCFGKYTILVGVNMFAFVAGNVGEHKYKNGVK